MREKIEKLRTFLLEVNQEIRKVTWPGKRELAGATVIVLLATIMMALILGLFDLVTSFRFFGNAQDELRSSALAAINRHLRPQGYLIINNH